MRQLLILFFSIFVLYSCNKDEALTTERTEGIQSMEKNGFYSSETGKLDANTWEGDLNRDYTDKCTKPDKVDVRSIAYAEISGKVTETERSTIESQIQSEIAKKRFHPFVIDVNERKGTVDLYFDDDGTFANPLLCDPVPDEGDTDCHFFDEHYAEATQCGQNGSQARNYFEGVADLRPNGGATLSGVTSFGEFCDETPDPLGGPTGRIMAAINANYPLPDDHLYFTDIAWVTLLGAPQRVDYDYHPFYETHTPQLWHNPLASGVNADFCLDSEEVSSYYCVTIALIEEKMPPGYYIIQPDFYRYNLCVPEPGVPACQNWLGRFMIGRSVSCCECCC